MEISNYKIARTQLIGLGWKRHYLKEKVLNFIPESPQNELEKIILKTFYQIFDVGETFYAFIQRLEPQLLKLGFYIATYSKKKRKEWLSDCKIISKRRLEIIYDTNLRTSMAAARWEDIQRRKDSMPYLKYICVMDEHTRDEHRRWHNLVLPVDHPFWQTHFPPNGLFCRCIVRQLSEGQIQREGYVKTDPNNIPI